MCGFVGFVNTEFLRTGGAGRQEPAGVTPAVSTGRERELTELLKSMTHVLQHRGPDASGFYTDSICYLGHQRLSVIDLSDSGKQPMSNEDGSVWLIYNGETYNFQELRSTYNLDSQGHRFRSKTDTEVLIHLYEELGPDFLQTLNGMYALALWDSRKRTLLLARDPYGIKPLFYLQQGSLFSFASEIKALLKLDDYTPRPNLEGLYHFLGFDYFPATLTAFENIHELRPGQSLILSAQASAPQLKSFFPVSYEIKRKMSEREAIEESLACLTKAVERQLIADVPVGVMLSGGMDSSALTALMAKVRGNADFHTFSLAFDDESFDESSFAKIVADEIGTTHHEIRVTPEKVLALLPRYLAYIDEPYADGSAIPTYLLAECARDFITVLLSGEGGDEVFAGYDTHEAYKILSLYRSVVPGFLRQGVIKPLVHKLPVSHKKLSLEFKAKRFTAGSELSIPHAHYFWRHVLTGEAKKQILAQPGLFENLKPSEQFFIDAFNVCQAQDDLNKLLYIDYSFFLPDDLMIKNDRMTMAHSLEARVPFTDNELFRFLATVPVKYKLKGFKKKYLLRTALKNHLPETILTKKKVGLEMPYSRWFRQELRELTDEMLSLKRLNETGLFNGREVRKLWQEHLDMQHDHGRFIWGMLNYMLWHELYIDKRNFEQYLITPRASRHVAN